MVCPRRVGTAAARERIHSTLMTFGHPLPSQRSARGPGRELLERLKIPEAWRGTVDTSLNLIEDLERQIDQVNRELGISGADHPYVPLLRAGGAGPSIRLADPRAALRVVRLTPGVA